MTTQTFTIRIGSKAEAEALFTYPNDGHEYQTLEQTISRYIGDSLARESVGISGVSVTITLTDVFVSFEHPDPEVGTAIARRYFSFFAVGLRGLLTSMAFKKTGKWNPKWQFLLPLGLPLEFAAAVEIMDFPPLSLIKKQDYLNSKTTSRWWELLQLNGVAPIDLPRYSCILDIVPVAAPANDGKSLDDSGIYEGPFDGYSLPLLELFSDKTASNHRRPLIALGLPIREWITRVWGLSLNVLDVGYLSISATETAPVIASHHPSFFFYASKAYDGEPDADAKNLSAGLAVMKQDIIAAAWHAEIGRNPAADPTSVLADSKAKWAQKEQELLDLVHKQAGIPKKPETLVLTEAFRRLEPSDVDLAALERSFHYGPSDGTTNDEN